MPVSSSTRRSLRRRACVRAEQFEDIILRTQTDGSQVRLRDVARIELGSEGYNSQGRYNGKPTAGLALKLATGANALDTIKAIDAQIEELRPFFPQGLEVVKPYDSTPFVRISIQEVVKTLIEAIVLVFLVMYLFLQNFRATLIPTIAVPVVLLGTFGVLAAFGFTINTLTMLGDGAGHRLAGGRRHRRGRKRRARDVGRRAAAA